MQQHFNQKEHCFIVVVFNVCLHGDSKNNHKNANELQSEAFEKHIENGLRVDVKNEKTLLVNANGHVDNYVFLPFSWHLHKWHRMHKGSNNLPRPCITAFGLAARLAHAMLLTLRR